jgi:hypothetical protein
MKRVSIILYGCPFKVPVPRGIDDIASRVGILRVFKNEKFDG